MWECRNGFPARQPAMARVKPTRSLPWNAPRTWPPVSAATTNKGMGTTSISCGFPDLALDLDAGFEIFECVAGADGDGVSGNANLLIGLLKPANREIGVPRGGILSGAGIHCVGSVDMGARSFIFAASQNSSSFSLDKAESFLSMLEAFLSIS